MPKSPHNKSTVHFIMTGGTIDSYYDGTKDTAVTSKESALPNFIAGLKLYIPTVFTEICMKDSRNLLVGDMWRVAKTIEKSKHKYFIVTHGTYSMSDTARYLEANIKRKDCVVILTGSMVPLLFPFSDAGINVGFALSELFHLEQGVYACMNGRIFKSNEVAKIIAQGRFISIFVENSKNK